MTEFNAPGRHIRKGAFAAVALLFGLMLTPPTVSADELPTFRHGLWDFNRAMGGKRTETRKCTDPSADILQKSGCKFSEVKKSENTFTFVADCPAEGIRSPELGGRMTVVLKVMSDSFYQVVADGIVDGKPTKEYLDARCVGDCPK